MSRLLILLQLDFALYDMFDYYKYKRFNSITKLLYKLHVFISIVTNYKIEFYNFTALTK